MGKMLRKCWFSTLNNQSIIIIQVQGGSNHTLTYHPKKEMKYWHNHFYSPCCKQLFRVRRVEINRWSISQSVWPPPQAPAKMACAALCQIFIPLHQADFTMSQQLLQPAAIYKHYFIKFSPLDAKDYSSHPGLVIIIDWLFNKLG